MDPHIPTLAITGGRRGPTIWPAVAREVVLLLGATVFLALTARIRIDLPFSPVPLTGQTLGVLLIGALYGPWRGALALLTYLAEGAAGLPVFAGGSSGLLVLAGPTGGYLVGFVPAAALCGWLANASRPIWQRGAGLLLATLVIYISGAGWMMLVLGITLERALAVGVLPYVPGDLFKAALAAGTAPSGARLFQALGVGHLPRPR